MQIDKENFTNFIITSNLLETTQEVAINMKQSDFALKNANIMK